MTPARLIVAVSTVAALAAVTLSVVSAMGGPSKGTEATEVHAADAPVAPPPAVPADQPPVQQPVVLEAVAPAPAPAEPVVVAVEPAQAPAPEVKDPKQEGDTEDPAKKGCDKNKADSSEWSGKHDKTGDEVAAWQDKDGKQDGFAVFGGNQDGDHHHGKHGRK